MCKLLILNCGIQVQIPCIEPRIRTHILSSNLCCAAMGLSEASCVRACARAQCVGCAPHLPVVAAHTCVPAVSMKSVCHWHSRSVHSGRQKTQQGTQGQGGDTADAYLYNGLKHMGERQERYQNILWGSDECTLKARTPARREKVRLPDAPSSPQSRAHGPSTLSTATSGYIFYTKE